MNRRRPSRKRNRRKMTKSLSDMILTYEKPELLELSMDQQAIVTLIAALRVKANAAHYVTGNAKHRSNDHPYASMVDGLGAEIAFASKFNLFPDLTYNPRKGGSDFTARNGRETIDVKTTKWEHGHLLVAPEKSADPSDLYVLMVGEFPSYRYAGYATKEQVFKEENLEVFLSKPSYAIDQNGLQK